jgi:1-acyl-sn-glycerol-3-phosphate acyltransferase
MHFYPFESGSMEGIFIAIYHFFKTRKILFWVSFGIMFMCMVFCTSRLTFEEDVSKIFPKNENVKTISEILKHAKMTERIVVMFSSNDSTADNPDVLVEAAERWVEGMEHLKTEINSIAATVDEGVFLHVLDTIQKYLPVFLEEEDYKTLDAFQDRDVIKSTLTHHYQQLISPSGVGIKKIIQNDPLGISFLVLKKMQQLYVDENFELYNGYIVTKDHRHLLCFVVPKYSNAETGKNVALIEGLDQLMIQVNSEHQEVHASYFGGAAVAVGNAVQLRRDTVLTVSIMLVVLIVLLYGFFKRKRIAFYIMLPVIVGCLFSLSIIYLCQGSLSILALAVGAVILGIAVNYSLHYLVDLRHVRNTEEVIRTLASPLTLGSATTIIAFFALRFTQAPMLRDVGLFSALSLLGAALCSLIVLPQLVPQSLFSHSDKHVIDRIIKPAPRAGKYAVYFILLITPFFYYHAQHVKFNSNMMSLNYMKPELQRAQDQLNKITQETNGSVFVVSTGNSLQRALQEGEKTLSSLKEMLYDKSHKLSSVHDFLLSDSIQNVRIARWDAYWSNAKVKNVISSTHEEGKQLRFSERLLSAIDSLLHKKYEPYPESVLSYFKNLWFDNYYVGLPNEVALITLVNVDRSFKTSIQEKLPASIHVFDQQQITEMFVTFIRDDFNFIVWITGSIVFIALLIVYGRIELTLLTFIPMMVTWIWILGIMALLDIEFNIVNIMVSTFIFGLGDDYSIFTMDGLMEEYRAAKKNLLSVRISVLLSALTTIVGLGVLIFAEHPALRSIALISIIGICSVYIMAQTLEPFFFRLLITNRTSKGLPPVTAAGFISSVVVYVFFVFGSFVLSLVGILLKLIPISREQKRYVLHVLMANVVRFLVFISFRYKKRKINYDPSLLDSPSVIIANHTSFLDVLLFTMLHPKLVLVTNKWVYRSPIFGAVVRMADYITVEEGVEESTKKTKALIEAGYSIVVFPEGTRSPNDKIGRFHKGAFYLAETYQLPILPVIIHGAGNGIRKGDLFVNSGILTMKFLPQISPTDLSFGEGYAQRTKQISRYFKEQYALLAEKEVSLSYYFQDLLNNYRYKGPVLEWYLRVKVRLENYYEVFHSLIPRNAKVLDLGCGYGFLSYMLQFSSKDRIITGVDYDADKIETAKYGYLKSDRLNFIEGDVNCVDVAGYDTIVISDVLHYLTAENQEALIKRCVEALPLNGKLIVRDGDADLKERHKGTKLTEWFSINVLKFNKATEKVSFISSSLLKQWLSSYEVFVNKIDDTQYTSNVIFVIQKLSKHE